MKGKFILILLILVNNYSDGKRHRITKRFIYPSGSVLQFAMGLALPATVTGRNIATNSGILINYALPTNVTQLKLPDIATTRFGQEQILNKILIILKKNNIDDECLQEILCFMNVYKFDSTSLIYELLEIIIQ
ncbi:hypothetical protein O3M35_008393 [Rhynocoris fuscipes]|uniref:Uncharacterized protein n=1 Tax=Rhynocoris fuscipes TaxID=488301 RepID=A0AAW1D6V9_9HEMI